MGKPPAIAPLLFGTTLALTVLQGCGGGPQEASGPPPVPVAFEELELATVETSTSFVGTLQAKTRVVLRPEISGRIEVISVEEGERVEPGTLMVSLDPERNQAALDSASGEAEAARAAVESSQAVVNSAEKQLRSVQASRLSAAAELEFASKEYRRFESLAADGAVSQERFDRARNRIANAVASLRSLEQDIATAKAELEQAEAGKVQAEQQLTSAEANVRVAAEDLRFKDVRAPIVGIVSDIPAKVGDVVDAGSALTTIIQNDVLEFNVNIPARFLPQLRLGLPVEIFEPEQREVIATGEVSFISPKVDQEAQVVLTKFTFANVDGNLRDGQFVQARVIWDTEPGVLVPVVAITRRGAETFVFVAEDSADGEATLVARETKVTLGPIQGQSYQVVSGIDVGDRIILNRLLDLRDGRTIVPETTEN